MFVDEQKEEYKEDQMKPYIKKDKYYVLREELVVDIPPDIVVQFFMNKGFVSQRQAALRQIAT